MPMSATHLRFLINRGTGLVRRGLASLRTRGWRASWARVLKQFRRVPQAQRVALYRPEGGPFVPFAVPGSTTPVASIVIPVFNQFDHTLECLRALAEHPPAAAVEIIVHVIVLAREHDGVVGFVDAGASGSGTEVEGGEGACVMGLQEAHDLLHFLLADVGGLDTDRLLHVC